MSPNLIRIARVYQARLEDMPAVRAVTMTYSPRMNTVMFTVLMDDIHEETERAIAELEIAMDQKYQDVAFGFRLIHLQGRSSSATSSY